MRFARHSLVLSLFAAILTVQGTLKRMNGPEPIDIAMGTANGDEELKPDFEEKQLEKERTYQDDQRETWLDISPIPHCYQECFRKENGKGSYGGAFVLRMTVYEWCFGPAANHWRFRHMEPCIKNHCPKGETLKFELWYFDLCGHIG